MISQQCIDQLAEFAGLDVRCLNRPGTPLKIDKTPTGSPALTWL
jgi:hypothetical protein